MSTLPLPPDLQQFVQDQLTQGKYPSESEVVCDAVRLLRDREQHLSALRAELHRGVEQLEQGDAIEIGSKVELDEFFKDVEQRGEKRSRENRDSL